MIMKQKVFVHGYINIVVITFLLISCKNDNLKKTEYPSVLEQLINQEDTDGDKKITIEDKGPKKFEFTDKNNKTYSIEGTYRLSNLLQELAIATHGDTISISRITEAPSTRISNS